MTKPDQQPDSRTIIFQPPNVPLIGWMLFAVLAFLSRDMPAGEVFSRLATLFIFTWAYLEITKGINIIRKVLGMVVMAVVLHSIVMG